MQVSREIAFESFVENEDENCIAVNCVCESDGGLLFVFINAIWIGASFVAPSVELSLCCRREAARKDLFV